MRTRAETELREVLGYDGPLAVRTVELLTDDEVDGLLSVCRDARRAAFVSDGQAVAVAAILMRARVRELGSRRAVQLGNEDAARIARAMPTGTSPARGVTGRPSAAQRAARLRRSPTKHHHPWAQLRPVTIGVVDGAATTDEE
jgi:hypothetical protein